LVRAHRQARRLTDEIHHRNLATIVVAMARGSAPEIRLGNLATIVVVMARGSAPET